MTELRRTKQPPKNPVRIQLERIVIAWNNCLTNVVGSMPPIILLRNAPPIFRLDFAYKFAEMGYIDKSEVSEFIERTIPSIKYKWKNMYV